MVFSPLETGPFWMTEAKREETCHDRIFEEEKTREFTKEELLKVLQKERGVSARGKKAAIQAIALEHGLPIWETIQIVVEGWEGKPKGFLQVLWECGIVDETRLSEYTINGWQNGYGVVDKPLP